MTISTYPPPNSNAAKISQKISQASSGYDSSNDDRSCNGGVDHEKVQGVKEYLYSRAFGPNATQKEVYDKVAAPLVDGLFPKRNQGNNFGESTLLFTFGVTNAGKTHIVMGLGLSSKPKTRMPKQVI
ncbi:hypothetical protein ACHAXS_001464 [Conticribra weissflogii]